MKLSAYHKSIGDSVEWYEPMFSGHMDKVYMSKVFTFTPDYEYFIDADIIIKGGTGYSYPNGGNSLSDEIEHIYPDYSIYYDKLPIVKDTAYGFLTRGCPRCCDFCIVGKKEGKCSVKVSNLSEFWREQKNIVLLDPNMFACKDWKVLSQQLIDSNAWIDFSQGCDIRILRDLGYSPYVMLYKKEKIPVGHKLRQLQRYVNSRVIFRSCDSFGNYQNFRRKPLSAYLPADECDFLAL